MFRTKSCFFLALIMYLTACDKDDPVPPNLSNSSGSVTTSLLVSANTQFALDLYKEVVDQDKNQVLSPFSISSALAMTYAGANANTAAEMQNVFGFFPSNSFHQDFNSLSNQIESNVNSPDSSEINVVNKIWRNQDISFLPDFNNIMTQDYQAPVDVTDFSQAATARQLINQWVNNETHSLIPDLLPSGFITNNTKSVLVNAVYFQADWLHPMNLFTQRQAFTTSANVVDSADMMTGSIPGADMKYTEDTEAKVLELFFDDKQSSMLFILPKDPTAGIDYFVKQILTSSRLDQWIADLAPAYPGAHFSVNIPKWDFGSSFDLAETLGAMGMPEAFSNSADFSKMSSTPLKIEKVIHKAVIKTHEKGAEAAAATAVGVGVTSSPNISGSFTADRPFVYIIKDTETNSILFIGHVQNPN